MGFFKICNSENSDVVEMTGECAVNRIFSVCGKETLSELELRRACSRFGVRFDDIRPYVSETEDGFVRVAQFATLRDCNV